MFYLHPSWQALLHSAVNTPSYLRLMHWLKTEYATKTIYPKADDVFNAFNLVPPHDVKVVIIGQDPYHGQGQAHGLCFSVQNLKIPPSLRNIFKELHSDIGCPIPTHGNLTSWANQGVLLLNTVLTVEEGKANSHKNKGWEEFTERVIQALNSSTQPLIFMLWGKHAQRFERQIDQNTHYLLKANHPSPLSANQGGWFGNKHFSTANAMLKTLNRPPINWQL